MRLRSVLRGLFLCYTCEQLKIIQEKVCSLINLLLKDESNYDIRQPARVLSALNVLEKITLQKLISNRI